jgi:tRNA (guanine37-N1)-methyltransferase
VGRAQAAGLVRVAAHDLREHTGDKHRTTDDAPFGGGPGMVMKAEPFFRAVESVMPERGLPGGAVVLLSPRGRRPDLLDRAALSPEDEALLREIEDEQWAKV